MNDTRDTSQTPLLPFTASDDVALILNALLDLYERHDPRRPFTRAIRVRLDELDLPDYLSQLDPAPRQTANQQLASLEAAGFIRLVWQRGDEGHLLESVALVPERAPELFRWLVRPPVAAQRAALRDLLLANRFRFPEGDWRRRAVDHTLGQLRANRSPAPFSLADLDYCRNLVDALSALDQIVEETPYRVFSVHTFNDSKLFESLRGALATLARRHGSGWNELSPAEALRELGLVPNPTHIYLYGPWLIERSDGRTVALEDFHPAAGIPALMIAAAQRVSVNAGLADRVICVENLASFYELVRYEGKGLAAVCLWGNPSPAMRHLLACLEQSAPPDLPLQIWADLDYGGFKIVSALRQHVSARFATYRMDVATLTAHLRWARPLTDPDRQHLTRLLGHGALVDLHPLIEFMLDAGLKLEQEAIQLTAR